uniref:WASH complex subunit 4 n=1 Tax=Rhizochromulina marina TaxID=1034831 RepID=A0A7S2WHU2_9STRA|eukprot:CAMPEP_0118984574 /NCGR_PEP_ID=MMETSP1173-20130426/38077_1 /TAXON_ID=1034831 /ORGANISM="Rhizochromulina marina cf, Strain CCMP1243" /LENGTH=1234 /DNA_ID=CAMNT_0006935249 /DNA_START=1 /DNA_END=3705 /DNA_ORIENTATION=+
MSWYVEEEEDADARRVDGVLQRMLLLVQEHEATLRHLEHAIGDTICSVPDEYYQPVGVSLTPQERVLPLDLVSTHEDEHLFKKVLAVFVYLCDEIHELEDIAQHTFFPKLLVFGTALANEDPDAPSPPGVVEKQMGSVLPMLQELYNFVARCRDVAVNLVQQLSRLYSATDKLFQTTFQFVRLTSVYESLCNLLRILVTLDAIIAQNSALQQGWAEYKRMMQFVRTEPEAFGTTEEATQRFERLLVQLDQLLAPRGAFKALADMDFEELLPSDEEDDGLAPATVNVRNNPQFLADLFTNLRLLLERDVSVVGTAAETDEKQRLVGTFALYVIYRRLTPAYVEPDVKFYKRLWAVQKTVPMVVLCGRVAWFPSDFIVDYVRLEVRKLDPPDVAAARRAFIDKFDEAFPAKVRESHAEVMVWLVAMESHMSGPLRHSQDPGATLDARGTLLLKGLVLAHRIQDLVCTLITGHLTLAVPMQRRSLRPLRTCVELLKALEFTGLRLSTAIAESLPHAMRSLAGRIHGLVRSIRAKAKSGKRQADGHKLDILAASSVVESILLGTDSFTFPRRAALQLGLAVCVNPNVVKSGEADGVWSVMRRLGVLASWQPRFRAACDCSFLLWNKELVQPFVEEIYGNPGEAHRIQYTVAAFADAARYFHDAAAAPALADDAQSSEASEGRLAAYRKFLVAALEEGLIKPLRRDVENDLRLRIHFKTQTGTLNEDTFNPKKTPSKALRPFLDLRPIRVLGTVVQVRQKVTRYLETTFYNLTTVALYDWMTYADMRNLAAQKFGLEIADNHLPMGSLEYNQGLDVLMIMRNIHVFVSRFSYNLNQQNFVERRPDRGSKNLNTINIQSIAASLRQHGLGILNTTVNFTYQFLAQKFHIFSQFLFDEYIRGHLSKERRWYRKHKSEYSNMYPHDRALKFLKDIRKLGVLENGRTFLDQFRILITEIGNALGYVRMVRSAGMHFCSQAVRFLPEIDEIIEFEPHAGEGREGAAAAAEGAEADGAGEESASSPTETIEGARLSGETVRAAKNLDEIIGTLSRNFSEGSDYFKVLVSVFQQVLMAGDHAHLDNFYMIIPALCLSWVDASYHAKMHMYKANRARDTYYTDDGFAMGLAYILAILGQDRKYDSLHWFQSMKAKLDADAKELKDRKAVREAKEQRRKQQQEQQARKSSSIFSSRRKSVQSVDVEENAEDEEEIHTLQQTENRLQATKGESDLLFFSLSGARIFFKQ